MLNIVEESVKGRSGVDQDMLKFWDHVSGIDAGEMVLAVKGC